MELDSRYYDDIFKRFMHECPMWANDVVSYRPKHMHAIRISLKNGDYVDYNFKTGLYQYRQGGQTIISRPNDVTDEDCREVFASNLSEFMNTRGVGQMALSERTGLSTAMISKYLNRKATPSITNLKKIAHALDCHFDELLE